MTLGIALVVFGFVALVSGYKNRSFADTLLGKQTSLGPTLPPAGSADTVSSASALPGAADTVPGVKGSTLLVSIGHVAEQFGLRVGECDAPGAPASWGPVHPVHTPTSLHYRRRAFDASGPESAMHSFAQWAESAYGPQLTELIHNPGFAVKNGQVVNGAVVYAAVWLGHRSHVHVGI